MKVKTAILLSVTCCIALLPMTIALADDDGCITNSTPFTLHLKHWVQFSSTTDEYYSPPTIHYWGDIITDSNINYIAYSTYYNNYVFDALLTPYGSVCFRIPTSIWGGTGVQGNIYVEKQAYPVSEGSTTMRWIGSTYLLGHIKFYNPTTGSFDVDHSQPNNCIADRTYIRKSGFSANIYCHSNAC